MRSGIDAPPLLCYLAGMKSSPLALLTGILLSPLILAPLTYAQEACQRATLDLIFKQDSEFASDRHLSPFDLDTQTEDAASRAGLNGNPALLSCQAGRPLCLKSEGEQWSLVTESGPQGLSLEKKNSKIVLTHLTRFHAGGDPWYGIGAQDWTRELRMTLDPSDGSLRTLLIDGAETTLGISKRTRAEGRCTRMDAEPIRKQIRSRLKQELFLSLSGKPASRREPIEANFLITPSGSLLQITGLSPETAELDLLDLESGETRRIHVDSLGSYRPVNAMAVLRDMNRMRTKTGPKPDGMNLRSLRCVQGANALLNPRNEPRDIRYRGYTEIELTPSKTGPGADLGYAPLSHFQIKRAGWEGQFRPATLPFGKTESIAVTDASGNAGFIAPGPNGIQSRPILRMDSRTASERYGLPAHLIAFEDTLCFAR